MRVSVPDAPALAATLEAEGFDVIEGSVQRSSLELVVSDASSALLTARGLELELIAVGRPYREIQREAMANSPEAVPAGYSDEELLGLGLSWVWIGLEGKQTAYEKLKGADTRSLVRQAIPPRVFGSRRGLGEHQPGPRR